MEQEHQHEKPNTILRIVLDQMRCADLDHFFSRIDLDPTLPMSDPDAHWRFRQKYQANKGEAYREMEEAPLTYQSEGVLRGWRLNARRLAYMLYYEEDPGSYADDLETLCGAPDCCVNPLHQRIRIKNG